MKRIQTPYVKLCPNCGMHGKIIFPDGSESKSFLVYEEMIEILRLAHIEGKLTHEECCMLRDQVNSSNVIKLEEIRKEFKKTLREEQDFKKFVEEKFKECDEGVIDFTMN